MKYEIWMDGALSYQIQYSRVNSMNPLLGHCQAQWKGKARDLPTVCPRAIVLRTYYDVDTPCKQYVIRRTVCRQGGQTIYWYSRGYNRFLTGSVLYHENPCRDAMDERCSILSTPMTIAACRRSLILTDPR
jgi:hypothetical protein